MKKLFLVFLSALILVSCNEKKRYTGTIVRMELERASKYNTISDRIVVFHSDSLNRNIPINVTQNAYVNLKEGQRVVFYLDEFDLNK